MSLTIRKARLHDVAKVHALHRANSGEFIWPRTLDELKVLTEEGSLIIAVDYGEVVGMCYVKEDEEPDESGPRWEYGGAFVAPALQRHGLATCLGIVAISLFLVDEQPRERLIAHVHEDNLAPRGMLTEQLGFHHVGQEIPPPDVAPCTLRQNAAGQVVGDLFLFDPATATRFADWLERFGDHLSGAGGDIPHVVIDIRHLREHRSLTIRALRALGQAAQA